MAPRKKTTPAKKQSASKSGDKINIENSGMRSAIAAGRRAVAAVFNINIRDFKWQPVVIILTIVGAFLAAILWFVIPRMPDKFSKQFNIAVSEFVVQDENGKTIHSPAGFDLADTITNQIEANFNDLRLNTVITYEIWGPDKTKVIHTEDEAREFANSTGATIIIYGWIKQSNGLSFFSPQFYVNHTAFKEAEEITGQHELGQNVQGRTNEGMLLIENPGVQARVNGMSMLTIGLVYYSVDRFDEAFSFFEKANNPDWVGSGKEVVYLLLGNTYIREASQTKDFSNLPTAEQYYQLALDVNPNYGRAMIGEANVLYLRAYTQEDCNSSGLDAASAELDQAFTLQGQPVSANIEPKVHFYRGQIALIRYDCQLPGDDWVTAAEQEFKWVVDRYETDPESDESLSIQFFVSLAYARLGYLAYNLHNNANTAITYMQKAIALTSPVNKADYTSILGDIYVAIGQNDKAQEAYQQAIAIAIGNGDPTKAAKVQEKIDSLTGP